MLATSRPLSLFYHNAVGTWRLMGTVSAVDDWDERTAEHLGKQMYHPPTWY